VHHHLNRKQVRMRLSLVVETGEARDTHQAATLFGFGASAICPYMAFDTIQEALEARQDREEAAARRLRLR